MSINNWKNPEGLKKPKFRLVLLVRLQMLAFMIQFYGGHQYKMLKFMFNTIFWLLFIFPLKDFFVLKIDKKNIEITILALEIFYEATWAIFSS